MKNKMGLLIKKHRKSLGMSQTEYAMFMGMGRFSTISAWETGRREAPYRVVFQVLEELGLFSIRKAI